MTMPQQDSLDPNFNRKKSGTAESAIVSPDSFYVGDPVPQHTYPLPPMYPPAPPMYPASPTTAPWPIFPPNPQEQPSPFNFTPQGWGLAWGLYKDEDGSYACKLNPMVPVGPDEAPLAYFLTQDVGESIAQQLNDTLKGVKKQVAPFSRLRRVKDTGDVVVWESDALPLDAEEVGVIWDAHATKVINRVLRGLLGPNIARSLTLEGVKLRTRNLAGRILTLLDVAIPGEAQNKALKGLVKREFRQTLGEFYEVAYRDPSTDQSEPVDEGTEL